MCEPDSILSATFQARTGRPDCACRCSLWCGHDLSTPGGLATTLEQVRTLKPKHVWISPPSGPFSPLQSLNQKSPSQIQDLKAKRPHAIKLYESTVEIVRVCVQLGIHVTVEMSERSEAWRLPIMQKLRFHMNLYTCVVKGCAVNLRGRDGQLRSLGMPDLRTNSTNRAVVSQPIVMPSAEAAAQSILLGTRQSLEGWCLRP